LSAVFAIELCNRIRKLFEPHGISLGGSATSMKINGVTITAYPSNHLDSMRGLDNVSFILLDEADFFPKHEQENARTISERYIQKSDPYIVMISTPNRPDGLFAQIERNHLNHAFTRSYS
jgi:late competence protein required for DNA uptake (superfamily II DNA/RNA helicase)